jgi:hypothetical protein
MFDKSCILFYPNAIVLLKEFCIAICQIIHTWHTVQKSGGVHILPPALVGIGLTDIPKIAPPPFQRLRNIQHEFPVSLFPMGNWDVVVGSREQQKQSWLIICCES